MFWKKKKLTADEQRAFQLLVDDKLKKAKEKRLRQLESDLIELLGLEIKLGNFFGISRWAVQEPSLRERVIGLIKEQLPNPYKGEK